MDLKDSKFLISLVSSSQTYYIALASDTCKKALLKTIEEISSATVIHKQLSKSREFKSDDEDDASKSKAALTRRQSEKSTSPTLQLNTHLAERLIFEQNTEISKLKNELKEAKDRENTLLQRIEELKKSNNQKLIEKDTIIAKKEAEIVRLNQLVERNVSNLSKWTEIFEQDPEKDYETAWQSAKRKGEELFNQELTFHRSEMEDLSKLSHSLYVPIAIGATNKSVDSFIHSKQPASDISRCRTTEQFVVDFATKLSEKRI